jgi:hypothetical protein
MKTRNLVLAAAMLSIAGCTELEVRKMPEGVVKGIPYALPKKIFLIAVEYELKECAAGRDEAGKPFFNLVIAKRPTSTWTVEPDENERYYIPYSSLRNWFKNTNVSVESYPNQTLSAVTITVEDKTGDAITAAVGTVVRVAALGSGVAMRVAGTEERKPACTPAVTDALQKIKAIEAKGKDQTEQDAAEVARLRLEVTHKEFLVWSPVKPPGRSEAPATMSVTIYPERLLGKNGKWVTQAGIDALRSRRDSFSNERLTRLVTVFSLDFQTPILPDPTTLPKGFLLRQGPIGLFRICDVACPAKIRGDATDVLKAEEHVIPQLGQYVVMPLRNRLFENQTLTIGVAADGSITKLGLKSDASAAAAFNTLNTSLDTISKAREAQEKAKAEARSAALNATKDNAARIAAEQQAIVDCLKAQEALRQLGGVPSGSCQ